jgi:hypothetical protein
MSEVYRCAVAIGRALAKKAVLGFACLLSILFVGGCLETPQPTGARTLEFEELVAHPQRYHGSEICTAGIYASGFETTALGASTYEVDGAVYLSQPAIWIEGAEIRARGDCIKTGGAPSAEFCQAEVCGLFESGGGFGHLGAYEYQLGAPGEERSPQSRGSPAWRPLRASCSRLQCIGLDQPIGDLNTLGLLLQAFPTLHAQTCSFLLVEPHVRPSRTLRVAERRAVHRWCANVRPI